MLLLLKIRRLSRIPLRHLSSAPIERRGSRMPSRSSSMKNPNSNGLGLGFSVNQTQLTKPTKENKSKTTNVFINVRKM